MGTTSAVHALMLACAVLAAAPVNLFGQSAPRANREVVAAAAAMDPQLPKGPVEPTWDSIKANYKTPDWWRDAKFGIMMHWGLYAVPAHGSEWYALHMYNNADILKWHQEHFGEQDKFGYKDFIPMFTGARYDPDAWATLFKKAGAKFVVPTAEHHDGFALYDSKVNRFNAKQMGPKRDLIGDMAIAVRKQGLKFGVSDHSMEHYTFIQINQNLKAHDLFDPEWKDFYSVADRNNPDNLTKFLANWVAKSFDLIDKYQPDILWYDNGVNPRTFDPLKLKVAAYYYSRAKEWNKEVSFSTKADAFLAGTIMDYERQGRAPKDLTEHVWQVDDPVLYRFGYTEDHPESFAKPEGVIRNLVNNVSKNGGLLLNISPKADGTIPDNQQELLLSIGKWLDVNGEAIYGSRPWKQAEEGNFRFTTKGDTLYATSLRWPGETATLAALGKDHANGIQRVELLGSSTPVQFTQDADGLKLMLPAQPVGEYAFVFKITGLQSK